MGELETKTILDYWFAMEFLSQDKYPESLEIRKKVAEHKYNIIKRTAKNKTIGNFISLNHKDIECNLFELITKEAKECDMKKWGNITFYIGKVKREFCIENISKFLQFNQSDEYRPEKTSDEVALLSLQLTPEGNYVKESLSISPIVWALSKIKSSNVNLSEALNSLSYRTSIESLELKFFDEKNNENINSDEIKNIVIPTNTENECETFSATAVTLKKLQKLYKEIEKLYLKNHVENSDDKNENYKEFYGISFQLFKDEDTKNKREDDNYVGLSHDYYSKDIKLVANTCCSKDKIFLEEDLQRYINNLNEETIESKKINVINSTLQLRQVNEIFSINNAPLGKWPSRFMPVFMQQMAINLAIGKGNTESFKVNGKIFSVNGPPGTGKTTLLKEIVVNNIIERARILAKYDNPEDAFEKKKFLCGDKENFAYSSYTRHWYKLKDDNINDYSILVTSSNNAAVENISKELPKSMLDDLKPLKDDSEELKELLLETEKLFDVEQSESVETTYKGESYNDIYFTKYAQDLLESENVWGLVAVPLGKKSNLSNFYHKVLYYLSRDFYKNKSMANERVEKYKKAKNKFMEQLKVVKSMRKNLSELGKLTAERLTAYEKKILAENNFCIVDTNSKNQIKVLHNNIEIIKININELNESYKNLKENEIKIQENLTEKNNAFSLAKSTRKTCLEKEREAYNSAKSIFTKLLNRKKYENAMNLANEYKEDAEKQLCNITNLEVEINELTQNLNNATKLSENEYVKLEYKKTKLNELLTKINEENSKIKFAETEKLKTDKNYKMINQQYENEVKKYIEGNDANSAVIADENFLEKLFSKDVNISTKAHVENPWFTQRYNREREKLFAYAMRLNKEFVLSSNHCRDNFTTLAQYWGLKAGDDNKKINFNHIDVENMVTSLFQTLFLLTPVVSSTFASVGSLFKDVKESGAIGMLVVDEAGQAQPQMALGALFRSRRAVIVGDPKQVEPVVTDDLMLLKKSFTDKSLRPYKKKTLSVQSFADKLNNFGTYLDNGTDYPEWVGCPLIVHRRCISPMYDISNEISYNGIMKQQARQPSKDKVKNFILEKSQWINVIGKEKGNKNHFVESQGKKVCELLEIAFSKTAEPNIYIITPFTTVVKGLEKYINEYCKNNSTNINKDYILDYEQKKIGTVHTFQGKEADEVIFVLGCDSSKESEGAIKWVNKNIVNVAVTRAKFRLYVIGDDKAWRNSSCLNEAKQIMDTFAIKKIKSILDENLPLEEAREALVCASKLLPPITQFTSGDEDSNDFNMDANTLIQGLNKDFLTIQLTTEQLERFGFNSMEDLNKFSTEIKNILILGIKVFFMLEHVYKVNKNLDASCTAILFCKAMELQMKDCFIDGLKNILPMFKINGFGKSRRQIFLQDAKDEEFTLGTFKLILEKNEHVIVKKMKDIGEEIYDEQWWKNFRIELEECSKKRNGCCHSGLFTWADQSLMLFLMFVGKNESDNSGLMLESQIGKKL